MHLLKKKKNQKWRRLTRFAMKLFIIISIVNTFNLIPFSYGGIVNTYLTQKCEERSAERSQSECTQDQTSFCHDPYQHSRRETKWTWSFGILSQRCTSYINFFFRMMAWRLLLTKFILLVTNYVTGFFIRWFFPLQIHCMVWYIFLLPMIHLQTTPPFVPMSIVSTIKYYHIELPHYRRAESFPRCV